MQNYISCKIVKAEPCTNKKFNELKGLDNDPSTEAIEGYLVVYPDGYVSWSPKIAFESSHRLITIDERELLKVSYNSENWKTFADAVNDCAPTSKPDCDCGCSGDPCIKSESKETHS